MTIKAFVDGKEVEIAVIRARSVTLGDAPRAKSIVTFEYEFTQCRFEGNGIEKTFYPPQFKFTPKPEKK